MYYLDRYHGIKISEFTVTRVEIPWVKPAAKDSSQTSSSHQAVCEKGSRTPRSVRCKVLAVESHRGKDSEKVPIYSHR